MAAIQEVEARRPRALAGFGSALSELFRFSSGFRTGAIMLGVVLVLAVLSFFSPYAAQGRQLVPSDLPPTFTHPFGTTSLGQDVFWLTTFAVRNSLIVGVVAVVIGRSIGLLLGTVAGYLGGMPDRLLSGLADSWIVIPRLPLLILIAAILKGALPLVALGVMLGLLDWAFPSKRYRSQIMSLREETFTQTAVFSGRSTLSVILGEHVPFLLPFVLADAISGFLYAIGMEITLSVLGLTQLAVPTIGTTIYWANYYDALLAGRLWWLAPPIIAAIVLVVAFYQLSTSLSQYLDPRTRVNSVRAQGSAR